MSYPSELPDQNNINAYYLPYNYDESTGTWSDLVGTKHFTQATSAYRPSLKDDIYNDKFQYVLFTSSSPHTKMTLPYDIANVDNKHTIFVVARRGKTVNSNGTITSYDGDGRIIQDETQNWLGGWWGNSEGVFYSNGWLNSNNKSYENNWTICAIRRDGSNKAFSCGYTGGNGGPYFTSGITRSPSSGQHTNTGGNTSTIRDLRLNDGRYSGEICDFHIGEILIYKTGLTDTLVGDVFDYLESKYLGTNGINGTGNIYSSGGGGGGGGLGIIAVPLATNDRGYDTNWVISVDKWDSYRSIGYQSTLDLSGLEDATIIAGGGGFDGSYNNIDASFRTQGDASTNWVVANYPASKAFNNDISYVGGQYFKASANTNSSYQNSAILADSNTNAVKLDFLFPYPRTATEYRIYPPNQPSVYDASYMPNRWCIYGSSYETIDTTKASTEANGYFLLDSRADVKPWTAHDSSLISVNGSYKTYKIANPGLYRQYRMSILQNSGNAAGELMIGELVYYEGGVGPIAGGGALDGRSDLSGGLALHGDVSGVTGDASGQYPYYAFDGDASNTSYIAPTGTFANNNLVSSKEYAIKFEFPEKKTVTKYDVLLTDPSNLSIREWELRGCDNSGTYNRANASTYTLLDARIVDNSGASSGASSGSYVLEAGGSGTENPNTLRPVYTTSDNAAGSTYSSGVLNGLNSDRAFNGTSSNSSDCFHSINHNPVEPNDPAWIAIKFPGTTTKKITKYKIWARNDSQKWQPVDWEIRGVATGVTYTGNSTSASDYTVLDTVTGETTWEQSNSNSVANNTEYKEFEITTPGYYNTYVINITNSVWTNSDSNGSYTCIGEWALYSFASGGGEINHRNTIVMNPQPFNYYVLDVTKSNYPSSASISQIKYYDVGKYPCAGAGSRDGSINTVGGFLVHGDASGGGQTSASDTSFNDLGTVPDVSGYAYNAFNNKLDISNSFIGKSHNTTDRTGPWELRYTFPEAKRITHYRIWPAIDNSGNTPCIWEMRGVDFSYNYNTINAGSYNILDKRDISGEAWTPSTTGSLTWGDLSGYKEYQMMNPSYYRQYIMYITGTNNSSAGREVVIGELAYYESDKVDVLTTREPQPYENHQLTINKGVSQETSDWEIGEILVFNKKLNADEEQSVVSYLERTFYGPDGYDPVGNNREIHLPRYNLKLSDVYSMMDPSALQIEYFHKQDYDRIIDLSSNMDLGIGDMSHAIIKTDDLRNRLLSTDASFTNMFGDKMGYEHNSIVRLSDFRGSHFSGGGGSGEGGTETTYSSGGISYKVHTFTTTGTATFVVSGTIKADFLIVAGGGGGGMDMGGGGGGGGVVAGTEYELESGTYTITVGDGGMGAPPASNNAYPAGQGRTSHQFQYNGNNGDDSSIVSGALNGGAGFIAKGGGYGGSSYRGHTLGSKPNSGGSGGGGSGFNNSGNLIPANGSSEHQSTQDTYTSITGVTGYGYPGGQSSGTAWYGSGGGGAGGTGLTAVGTSVYPVGGPGIQISWVTPEALNVTGGSHGVADATPFYWAGGGGGSGYSQNGGNGGLGGGGGGAIRHGHATGMWGGSGGLNSGGDGGGGNRNSHGNRPGGNAGANTGSGGGGGSHYSSNNKGGNGGAGIVVIRYEG